jgi:hypothetical protein
VPTAEVGLCVHCVNAVSICWGNTEVFCFVLFLLFQVPLTSYASPWRAGEADILTLAAKSPIFAEQSYSLS